MQIYMLKWPKKFTYSYKTDQFHEESKILFSPNSIEDTLYGYILR